MEQVKTCQTIERKLLLIHPGQNDCLGGVESLTAKCFIQALEKA